MLLAVLRAYFRSQSSRRAEETDFRTAPKSKMTNEAGMFLRFSYLLKTLRSIPDWQKLAGQEEIGSLCRFQVFRSWPQERNRNVAYFQRISSGECFHYSRFARTEGAGAPGDLFLARHTALAYERSRNVADFKSVDVDGYLHYSRFGPLDRFGLTS